MKIATYNVNSIRRRLPMVLDWLTENKPDAMCLQETKVQDEEFPIAAIRSAGYHAAFRGMKGSLHDGHPIEDAVRAAEVDSSFVGNDLLVQIARAVGTALGRIGSHST